MTTVLDGESLTITTATPIVPTTPRRAAPRRAAPHRTAPHRSAPRHTAPHRTAPRRCPSATWWLVCAPTFPHYSAVSPPTSGLTTLGLAPAPPYCRGKYRAYSSKPSTHSTSTFFFHLRSYSRCLRASISKIFPTTFSLIFSNFGGVCIYTAR